MDIITNHLGILFFSSDLFEKGCGWVGGREGRGTGWIENAYSGEGWRRVWTDFSYSF
jgi:hypothetical protein